MKKLISIICAISILATMLSCFTASAATTIYNHSGIVDYYDDEFGEFTLKNKAKVKILFNSSAYVDLLIWNDDTEDDVVDVEDINTYTKTVTLNKGTYSYCVSYYYYDYDYLDDFDDYDDDYDDDDYDEVVEALRDEISDLEYDLEYYDVDDFDSVDEYNKFYEDTTKQIAALKEELDSLIGNPYDDDELEDDEDDEDDEYFDNSASFTISVQDVSTYATSIKLKATSKTLSVGSTYTIGYTKSPADSICKNLSWSSSNTKVATVNSSGKVTAKGLGKCTITAKLNGSKTYKFTVTVNSKKLYIFKGTERGLPKINGSKTATWKSKNKSYATVNKQKVKGKKAGATSVTAKYSGVTYTENIYVVDYDSMLKDCKSKLKDKLLVPNSLVIYHIWRGYDSDGKPTITLDYGAKNAYGVTVRDDYFNYYRYYDTKSKKFKNGSYFKESRPKLTAEKKIK